VIVFRRRLVREASERRLVPIALLLALTVACGGGRASERPEASRGEDEARQVEVSPARADRLVRKIAVTGTLAAEEQVTLSMKVAGRLDQLSVDLGSRVTQGQVLARLVPTDFNLRENQARAALQQARARLGLPLDGGDNRIDIEQTAIVRSARALLEEARLNRDRTETFVARGISAKATLDAAEAALQVADSRYQDALEEVRNRQALLEQRSTELELARQAVRDSSLTAPLDGMVRERHASAGQFLAAGTPVVTIVRVHPLRLRLAVPERDSQLVRARQEVQVTVEGAAVVHTGRIARVSPAIDETSRTLMVEAEIPNPRAELRPGSFATATIVTTTSDQALVIPTSAIVTFAGVDKVLIAREGKVAEKRVTVGRRDAELAEIVEGLSAGDPVIVRPGNLVEGAPVRVTNAASGGVERANAR
jgi:RND family efflux transporter MFP subunit